MSVDLSQFHQVFFEESLEGLDVMESALLNLSVNEVDPETINEVFRSAHSIKGGAGTFGFTSVAGFAHVMETLLDQIRSDDIALAGSHVELLLQSVDCMRAMIQSLTAGKQPETANADLLKRQFEQIVTGTGTSQESQEKKVSGEVGPVVRGSPDRAVKKWRIFFKPDTGILKTGNEPLRMFRELQEMGPVSVMAQVENVPPIGSIDPESCYLSWLIELEADVDRSAIEDVFEWVIDESELNIDRVENRSSSGFGTCGQPDDSERPVEAAISVAPTPVTLPSSLVPPLSTPIPPLSTPVPPSLPDKVPVRSAQSPEMVARPKRQEASSIRVGIDKIDSLINLVGELVITQSMLSELGRDFEIDKLPVLLEGLEQLSQHTRELQESMMSIRMLPISFTFSRFPRLVHDLSRKTGKKIELKLSGEQTELDKTVMEKIGDPIVHLVRNSLDHGIETPDERIAAGKDETGTITLNAYHRGGSVVIQIIDDGRGLDRDKILARAIEKGMVNEEDALTDDQVCELIFQPGFSTTERITHISGRGVGMDVVRRNIQELNGSVEVESEPGCGCVFTIRLPLTLAILDGQLIRVSCHTYVLPLIAIIESVSRGMAIVQSVADGHDVLKMHEEYVPIVRLDDVLNVEPKQQETEDSLLVVVEGDNMKVALLVDDLLAQQQVVIKSLEENYKRVEGVFGATILGNGSVAFILDISGLIRLAGVSRDDYNRLNRGGNRAT
ncbi:MAG: chemotaxis protein CheA [Gammaproteobacteria bacterium]|nr:MAG: chemotaxis protein CheA [Pseudomonadota bacterium]PIE38107.1 MAG: chemotaxis protein CheA [Gammaproteobacteria bacterium]